MSILSSLLGVSGPVEKREVVLGIVGTRRYIDPDLICQLTDRFVQEQGLEVTKVVSGGQTGVDSIAKHYAKKHRIPFEEFPPATKTREGFHARNQQIVDASDVLFAFPDADSVGTYVTIRMAETKGIPVTTHEVAYSPST